MKRLAAILLLFTGVLAQDFEVDPERPAEDESTPAYRKALKSLEKGRFKSAQRAFRKFIKKYPDSTHVKDALDRSDDNCYLGTEVLWRGGPWQRRIDVAVMGDGFTVDISGQKKQQKWAKLCVDVLWHEKAFSQYRSYFNIYFVRLGSLEEGVDPQLSPDQLAKIKEKNRYRSKSRQKKTDFSTALDAKAAGPQGQVMMDKRLVYKWLKIANEDVPGVGDDRYVIAFAQFGRLGMGGGGIANVGRPDKSVTTHEFGHAFSRLLDEYANNPKAPTGMWGRRIRAANAHRSDKEPKPTEVPWAHMLKKRIKGVGIYEGGATYKKGVWRPASTCAMNAAGASGFCPVCREQSIKVIYEYINPIDLASPDAFNDVVANEGEEKFLRVTPMEPYKHKLEVTWYVADRAVTKSEGSGDEELPEVDLPGVEGGGENKGDMIDGRPFGDRGMGGGRRRGMPGFSGNRGMQDRSNYKRAPRGKLSRIAKKIKAKGKREKRVPPHSIFNLGKLGPGNWEITCRVRDRTRWVIKDEKHLLEERVTWRVKIIAKPEAAAPGK